MFNFVANIFGYLLNFIYNLVNNYGVAIILFTLFVKVILIPISIKQQKTMKKSSELQVELRAIQEKYKNDQERANKEMMALYKQNNMSPFSGCLSSIVQIILLLSVFYLVSRPLTYMKKVDLELIDKYKDELSLKSNYPEVRIIREKGSEDDRVYLNMNFLGLDLSNVPSYNYKDFKVFVIPILYVISSIISMKMTLNMQDKKKIKENNEKENETNPMPDMSKSMSYMMPIMAVSISLVAPLGLALYWLVNNVLMITERIILDKFILNKEDGKENEAK